MPGAFKPPAPQSACAVYVRTRPRRGLAGVFAFVCREDASPRMSVGYESRIYRPSMSQMGQSRRLSDVGMSASPPDFGRLGRSEPTLWANSVEEVRQQ